MRTSTSMDSTAAVVFTLSGNSAAGLETAGVGKTDPFRKRKTKRGIKLPSLDVRVGLSVVRPEFGKGKFCQLKNVVNFFFLSNMFLFYLILHFLKMCL